MKLEQRLRRLSRGGRLRVVRVLRELFSGDDSVVFAYVHGSILGEGPVRDVDVAVWLREGVDPLSYTIEKGLEAERTLRLPVDVQVLNVAPVTFRYTVYSRGLPLVVKDKHLHDREVAMTILMYLDLKTLRETAGKRRAAEG